MVLLLKARAAYCGVGSRRAWSPPAGGPRRPLPSRLLPPAGGGRSRARARSSSSQRRVLPGRRRGAGGVRGPLRAGASQERRRVAHVAPAAACARHAEPGCRGALPAPAPMPMDSRPGLRAVHAEETSHGGPRAKPRDASCADSLGRPASRRGASRRWGRNTGPGSTALPGAMLPRASSCARAVRLARRGVGHLPSASKRRSGSRDILRERGEATRARAPPLRDARASIAGESRQRRQRAHDPDAARPRAFRSYLDQRVALARGERSRPGGQVSLSTPLRSRRCAGWGAYRRAADWGLGTSRRRPTGCGRGDADARLSARCARR